MCGNTLRLHTEMIMKNDLVECNCGYLFRAGE